MDEDGKGGILPRSPLLRCDPFDGYPSLTNGKADAQIVCIDPTLANHPNAELLRNAYVERLNTDAGGRTITSADVLNRGREAHPACQCLRGGLRRLIIRAPVLPFGK